VEKILDVFKPLPSPVKSITKKQVNAPYMVEILPKPLSKLLPNANLI
jgi:hypothetical protein